MFSLIILLLCSVDISANIRVVSLGFGWNYPSHDLSTEYVDWLSSKLQRLSRKLLIDEFNLEGFVSLKPKIYH